ncbi:MAG: transglutaminase domain-containing protein [Planctomycetes bacterium]|nr:transglutaminase domain-containing protein [Planctomycetota bacterium]
MESSSPRKLLVLCGLLLFWLGLPSCGLILGSDEHVAMSSARTFEFSFEVTVPAEVSENPEPIRLWVPVPISDHAQIVELLNAPEGVSWSTPDVHGNRFGYLQWELGMPATMTWTWRVHRMQDLGSPDKGDRFSAEEIVMQNYLDSDLGVPVRGAAAEIAREVAASVEPIDFSRALYDRVLADMRFDTSGSGPGHGSTDWAVSEGYGDSTDYQAFYISASRSNMIAARFQVGYLLPLERGRGDITDVHSWNHIYQQGTGWFPMDLALADQDPIRTDYFYGHLTTNRIGISCGRDIQLDPIQSGGGLSFVQKPYAEQGGLDVPVLVRTHFQDLPTLTSLQPNTEYGIWP